MRVYLFNITILAHRNYNFWMFSNMGEMRWGGTIKSGLGHKIREHDTDPMIPMIILY